MGNRCRKWLDHIGTDIRESVDMALSAETVY
jgi:hypothetical protein